MPVTTIAGPTAVSVSSSRDRYVRVKNTGSSGIELSHDSTFAIGNGFPLASGAEDEFYIAAGERLWALNTQVLAAPSGLAASPVAGGGSFAAGTYYWKITGLNAAGETVGSSEVNAVVAANGHVDLTWSALTGATGYRIYRASSSGGQNVSPALVTQVGQVTAYTDTGTATTAGAVPAASTASVPTTVATI